MVTSDVSPAEGVPDVTILMPCLNERVSLPKCIDTAEEALRTLASSGLTGEVLISDNGSHDGSQEYARSRGCRVTECPVRGYGAALIQGIREAGGRFIIMGDADASYDFREGVPMVLKLVEGYDLCMGNRFRGTILPGAMPPLNRYLGNPALSGLLNLFFHSGIGDAHSGLRAFRRDAVIELQLVSPGMEFASELVVKAALKRLRMAEVPITLHPDGRDRRPHLRPWRDGWRHLRFLLALAPMWLFIIPSLVLLGLALLIGVILLATPTTRVASWGGFWIGDHWLILAGGMLQLGLAGITLGTIARVWSSKRGFVSRSRRLDRWVRLVKKDHAVLTGTLIATVGLLVLCGVAFDFLRGGFGSGGRIRESVVATALLVGGIQIVFASFVVSLIDDTLPDRMERGSPSVGHRSSQ
jgi:glycosyltransferase involved in cell wall biosynthesis